MTSSEAGLSCKLLPLQLFNLKLSDFVGVSSCIQQDKLVAQHKDGGLSVLQVKASGVVSNFVLDPNLYIAFWDNEEVSDSGQQLFAQMRNGDVILYAVDDDGVTEKLHLSFQKLCEAVKTIPGVAVICQLKLVGCDKRQIILFDDDQTLYSVQVSLRSNPHVDCSILLPQAITKYEGPHSLKKYFTIQNGSVLTFDYAADMIFMYSLNQGHCFCQVDVKPLDIPADSVREWRMSYDLSVLMLLLEKDWMVVRVDLTAHSQASPSNVMRVNTGEVERAHHQQYLTYNLCWYGDMTWKRDVVWEHTGTVRNKQPTSQRTERKKQSGFRSKKKAANKRGGPLLRSQLLVCESKEVLSLARGENKQGWTLQAMETSLDVVALVMVNESAAPGSDFSKALCFANFRDKTFEVSNVNDSITVILSNMPACSHMLLSEKCLVFMSPHTSLHKDDLITKMMSYGGPSSADGLCQANEWTRTAVPYLALEASLQQRQLDTLAFFFKSKQNLFSTWNQQASDEKSIKAEVDQLEAVLRLVLSTASVTDAQAKIFSERLFSLSLEFVYELLDDAKNSTRQSLITPERSVVIERSSKIFISSAQSLRQCLQSLQTKSHQSATKSSLHEQQTNDVKDQIRLPASSETPEHSVKENKLSTLQCLQFESQNQVPFSKTIEELLSKVDTYLRERNIPACQSILSNMGCDVLTTLWSLAQFYTSRTLQQYVTGQLSGAAALAPAQRQLLQYTEQLYAAYPALSFSAAMREKAQMDPGNWSDRENPLKSVLMSNKLFLLSLCGELGDDAEETPASQANQTQQNAENMLYACILLAWLGTWTQDMKSSVLVDAHFLKGGDALTSLRNDPTTWQYLISHNFLDDLRKLLETSKKEEDFPWPANLTESLHLGWSHLRNELAKSLLRMGKLDVSSIKKQGIDLDSVLATVGGPILKPHPLSYLGVTKMQAIHSDFLKYCVSAGLQLPLWMYCTVHDLNPGEIKLAQTASWFPVLQALYKIPRHPTDKTVVLAASLVSASQLWAVRTGGNVVEEMMEKEQILTAVGTLSFMSQEDVNLDPARIEQYLSKFPKLMAALLPEGHKAVAKENTTVYQLLMGTTPFDLRRLFGWQSTNTFAREDSPHVMPHFSEPTMFLRHSHNARLSFPYYLKQGRPVYGFLSFLTEELDRREAPLSQKRIQQACGAASWLACQNFNTPRVSSACVVFVELLGRDSVLLRTLVNCGRMLLAYRHPKPSRSKEKKDGKESAANKSENALKDCVSDIVSELLASLHKKHSQPDKLIRSVEAAIKDEIKAEGIGRCSFEASQKWTMVLMLCHLLSCPLSTCFLQACAETDNWLMFVWFAQLHQYPAHQLQKTLHRFKSVHLRDHLHYVINNADSKMFTAAVKSPSRKNSMDTQRRKQRMSLYNKIGVQKNKNVSSSEEETEETQTSGRVISSFSTRLKETELNESEMAEASAPDDVFRMLFYSRSMPSQWKCLLSASVVLRNPLFAELSACCGCPPVSCLCGWLLACLEESVKKSFMEEHGRHVFRWTTTHLEALINVVLLCRQEDCLATAFIILQPNSPLLPFMCFINEFVKRGTYAACKTFIDQFKDAITSWDGAKQKADSSNDVPTIGDKPWFEKVAYQVLLHELKVTDNLYHARHLLEILDKQNVCLIFSFDVLNFAVLHKVVTILQSTSVSGLDIPELLTSGTRSEQFQNQVQAALDQLISQDLYTEARDLAEAASVGIETVNIRQLKHEKEQLISCGLWSAKYVRAQFWGKCHQSMGPDQCCAHTRSEFFKAEIAGTDIEAEKAILYEHWFSLMGDVDKVEDSQCKDAVFREMWRHRIAAKIALEEVEALDLVFDHDNLCHTKRGDLRGDLLEVSHEPVIVSDIQEDLTAQELEVLDSLMGVYLDEARIAACARVAAVFGHYNQDLAIVQTCIALANGTCRPDSIEPAMRRLLAKLASNRLRSVSINRARSQSTSSLASVSSLASENSASVDTQDVTSVMEKLFSHCVKGRQVCLRIITCFKMAVMLDCDYKTLILQPEFDSLRQLLRINHANKFVVARDFLTSSGLSDDEVTGFLADSIVDVLKMFVKGGNEEDDEEEAEVQSSEMMFNPADGMEVFSQFLKLCENTSLLGDRILQAATALFTSNQGDMTSKVLTIQTELIIMAHECYTTASSMEGISHVLRVSRVCCNSLTEAKEYALIIRLLTGVGRYSEMVYIFHALQQHYQFELLLRKGMDREDKLKVAILDYLKRYQPDDSEAYTMVALKFSMYRDIAAMLETCGHRALKHFKDKCLDNSKDTQESLKKCLQYFQDAAESYVKDNSVRKAQHCVKLARLVSLQLQLLPSGITVVHMTRDQVTVFTNAHTRFIEAMVVADAYERRMDWSDAVYNNVVCNNDLRYLQEMKLHVVVTPGLVEDVVKLYKNANPKPTAGLPAIRKLLASCKDAMLQYRLAMDLGLTDIVTAMLKADTGSFLQDVTVMTM